MHNTPHRLTTRTAWALAVAATLATGCANINKEQIGTMAGGVLGAVVGQKAGGNSGMVLGALVGGAIGNRLGAHLDTEDRARLAQLEQTALATGQGGSFVSQKSQATVTVAAAPSTVEKPRDYALVASAKPEVLFLINPITVNAFVDTPVFDTVDETHEPRLLLQQGVSLRIGALVQNHPWAVVGDERVGLGYVPMRYLNERVRQTTSTPAPATASAAAAATAVAAAPARPAALPARPAGAQVAAASGRPAANTVPRATSAGKGAAPKASTPLTAQQYNDEMAALHAAYQPRNPGGPAATTAAEAPRAGSFRMAKALTECKVVSRQVIPPNGGKPIVEDVKYCNEPPHGWQAQMV